MTDHAGIGWRFDACFPGWDANIWRLYFAAVELCLALELTSRSYWSEVPSDYRQWSFSANIKTPMGGGRSILESVTNRIHQVDLISLYGLCFVLKILCKMKQVTNVERTPTLWDSQFLEDTGLVWGAHRLNTNIVYCFCFKNNFCFDGSKYKTFVLSDSQKHSEFIFFILLAHLSILGTESF